MSDTPTHTRAPTDGNGNGKGNLGLTGWWKLAGNVSALVIIAGSFLFLQYTLIVSNKAEIVEGRANFRDTLREIMHEQRTNTGAIKDALQADAEATRALTEEIRRRTPPRQP